MRGDAGRGQVAAVGVPGGLRVRSRHNDLPGLCAPGCGIERTMSAPARQGTDQAHPVAPVPGCGRSIPALHLVEADDALTRQHWRVGSRDYARCAGATSRSLTSSTVTPGISLRCSDDLLRPAPPAELDPVREIRHMDPDPKIKPGTGERNHRLGVVVSRSRDGGSRGQAAGSRVTL